MMEKNIIYNLIFYIYLDQIIKLFFKKCEKLKKKNIYICLLIEYKCFTVILKFFTFQLILFKK